MDPHIKVDGGYPVHSEAKAQGLAQNVHAMHVDDCGGLDKIDQLREHKNTDIYEKAVKILETYFGAEDEEDDFKKKKPKSAMKKC